MKLMEMNEKELMAKYEGATAIYALQRRKKMSKKEAVFDFFVSLFTDMPGIIEEADGLADMGAYYWVQKDGKDLLVRVGKETVEEEDMTGKLKKKKEKTFVYDGNKYAIFKELLTGKAYFTLNI